MDLLVCEVEKRWKQSFEVDGTVQNPILAAIY